MTPERPVPGKPTPTPHMPRRILRGRRGGPPTAGAVVGPDPKGGGLSGGAAAVPDRDA